MGILDFFLGGNVRVIAKSISRLHFLHNGDHEKVLDVIFDRIYPDLLKCDCHKSLQISRACMVRNYAELGCYHLFVSASPSIANWDDIRDSFCDEMIKYLRKENIPEKYITGSVYLYDLSLLRDSVGRHSFFSELYPMLRLIKDKR
ncbi:hypothetical protein E9Z77_002212 [Escherichia coli]|uniref:hypothetical protein n=1 Tax=Escherichia coli TaxID=562 RepID=UPI003BF879DE|nr:hypothetical protein [Escherichia coli]